MNNFNEIWTFVEDKLKCTVPPYFKNVLKACGFDNGFAIASIDDEDVKYLEEEVRNGNVSKYFGKEQRINVLDGSTKTVANFEFTRGHKKFLLCIRDFLKNYLKEINSDSSMQSQLMTMLSKIDFYHNSNGNVSICNKKISNTISESPKIDLDQDMNLHHVIVICKVIISLIETTPSMYAMNMETVNKKIALVKVQIKDNKSAGTFKISERKPNTVLILEAVICCPFCSTSVTACHELIETNDFAWTLPNFKLHLELAHTNQTDESKNVKVDFTSDFTKSCSKKLECKKALHHDASATPTPCYSGTFGEDKIHTYSKILKKSLINQKTILTDLQETINSKSILDKHSGKSVVMMTKESLGFDKTNEFVSPQLGNYVICSLLVRDAKKWPVTGNVKKNFVGKISRMEDQVDEIWMFIEDKLKCTVPPYFKNVLKACGFDNGFAIASIDDEDVKYLEEEVRNGNVSKYFEKEERINVLDGSTKTVANFEFTRGHKIFLITIKDFLKNHCGENGIGSFVSELAHYREETQKRKTNMKSYSAHRKKFRNLSLESSSKCSSLDDLNIEKNILIGKAITSLVRHTPEMYVKARVKDIEMKDTKTSTGLVIMEIHESKSEISADQIDTSRYVAKIVCPLCSESISVPHSNTKQISGSPREPWWNMSGFNRHLNGIHKTYDLEEHFESIDQNVKDRQHATSVNVDEIGMLQRFISSAEKNSTRKKPGFRFDILIKMFAAYIKMVAGLLAYETLHANFPLSLPSVSTVNRFLADNAPQIVEGEMQTNELLKHLQSRNLRLQISLSEDATRIIPKISYDSKTNQLIGFALPLDVNGMPIPLSFPARNVREIYQHFTNTSNFVSSNAYVQMAQPNEPNSPPFCCLIFSTDCKFTALNVLKRWQFQAQTLKEKEIEINNIASDGDSRPLMAMKVLSRIGQQDLSYLDCEWFSCGGFVETTFTQDVVHIITKSRNRVLTCSRLFPIGNKIISSTHLKYLVQHVSKDKHLLTYSDIEPKDRQNFLSADKICSEKTIQCLSDYVPESQGTIIYLKMMRSILNAFITTEMTSRKRVYEIWYALFFCRAWRSWLLNSRKVKNPGEKKSKHFYNLKDNFISSNCYTCIELNAHALVKQVLVNKENEFFCPNFFDSQVCESTFRQLRSFTSTYCTVVNFNMLEIIHRVRKIQLQNEIITACNERIKFPRFEKNAGLSKESHRLERLTQIEVIIQIEDAKNNVKHDLEELGIDTSKLDFHCQIKPVFEEDLVSSEKQIDSDLDSDFEESYELSSALGIADFFDDEHEEDAELQEGAEFKKNVNFLSGITGELMLKEYNPQCKEFIDSTKIDLDEKSRFVVVTDNSGKEKVVLKSAVCYVLCRDKHKLSSDRLQRVKEKDYEIKNKNEINCTIPNSKVFIKNQEIFIGSWCIFSDLVDKEVRRLLLGLVLEFKYLNGKTFREKEFSKSSAPVKSSASKNIGVLCNFYSFNNVGVLSCVAKEEHKFVIIEDYIGTIKEPLYANSLLTISPELVIELMKLNDK